MYYSKDFPTDTVVVQVTGNKGGHSYIAFKSDDFSVMIEKATYGDPSEYHLKISDIEYDMNISLEDYTEIAVRWDVVFSLDFPEWIGIYFMID